MDIQSFVEQFDKVFDKDGNVKACGRDNCKKLISMANAISNEANYGDIQTGMMNVVSMKSLRDSL